MLLIWQSICLVSSVCLLGVQPTTLQLLWTTCRYCCCVMMLVILLLPVSTQCHPMTMLTLICWSLSMTLTRWWWWWRWSRGELNTCRVRVRHRWKTTQTDTSFTVLETFCKTDVREYNTCSNTLAVWISLNSSLISQNRYCWYYDRHMCA